MILHRRIVGRDFRVVTRLNARTKPFGRGGNNKIQQKSAISAVALSWRRRAAFWGNAANVLFAPSPKRVFPRTPFPLSLSPLCRFFMRLEILGLSATLHCRSWRRLPCLAQTYRTMYYGACNYDFLRGWVGLSRTSHRTVLGLLSPFRALFCGTASLSPRAVLRGFFPLSA